MEGRVCERTHVDGLFFEIAEAEQFVEWLICAILYHFLASPGQPVDDIHYYGRSFAKAF